MGDWLKRSSWCPHKTCKNLRTLQDKMCVGKLMKKEEHDGDFNTHRICLDTKETGHGVFDLQINKTDCYWFRLLFDAIDKRDKI